MFKGQTGKKGAHEVGKREQQEWTENSIQCYRSQGKNILQEELISFIEYHGEMQKTRHCLQCAGCTLPSSRGCQSVKGDPQICTELCGHVQRPWMRIKSVPWLW